MKTNTRKIWRYAVFICIFVGIYFLAFKRRYYVKVSLYPYVHTLWNEKEAFIFIGNKKTGVKGTPLGLLYHNVMGIFDMLDVDSQNDFTVVHVVNGRHEDSTFRNVNTSGTLFPLAGNIYYAGYSGEEQHLWRWNGKTFEMINDDKGSSIMNSFQYFSDVIRKEGWREADLPSSPTEDTLEIRLRSGSLKLILQRQAASHQVIRVLLQSSTNPPANETLAEIVPKWEKRSQE